MATDNRTENFIDTLFSVVPTVSMLCVRKQADNMLSLYRRQHDSDVLRVSRGELRMPVTISTSTSPSVQRVRGQNGRRKMALELLGLCGMIWRSLKRTLCPSATSGFRSARPENRIAAERGYRNPDVNDAVPVHVRAVVFSKREFSGLFFDFCFLNLSGNAGV